MLNNARPAPVLAACLVVVVTSACGGVEYITVDRAPQVGVNGQNGQDGDDGDDGSEGEGEGEAVGSGGLWIRRDATWDDGAGTETPIASAQIYVPLQSDADCALVPPIGESLVVHVAIPDDDGDRGGAYTHCDAESGGLSWYGQRCFTASRMTGAMGADVADDGDTLDVAAWQGDDGAITATITASGFPTTTFTATRCAD